LNGWNLEVTYETTLAFNRNELSRLERLERFERLELKQL
jgi:hypothetical protein